MPSNELYFSWSGAEQTGEDQITTTYMQETAAEAGFETVALEIEDVGWDSALERFVDLEGAPMAGMFKLYPWEWIFADAFGKRVVSSLPETLWLEPLWKSLLSNKAMLAVLWEMYPGHPNLLLPPLVTPRTHRVRPQTDARPGGRQHPDRRAWRRDGDRRRLRRRGLRLQLFDPLPVSTASGPRSARGWSAIRLRGWGSARPAD